ncbi:MAG TPA: GNAT family N-acetyltransferase [Candidatus Lokiarchaeia archaeon]|nr:GNAT family N-acetyltransferase [Candidatus Lokiarchaeia archaeon]
METRRFQSKDPSDKIAITDIIKEELALHNESFDEKVWEDYLKKRDGDLQNRMGTILAVDDGTVAGFVLTEVRYEMTGKPFGYMHFPAVKREYKTKVEEMLCIEAIKYLKSIKGIKVIRSRLSPAQKLAISVAMKLHFKQFELEWQLLV